MAPHSHDPTPSDDDAIALWNRTDELLATLEDAEGLLLLLDFDGTLAAITERPEEASILPESASTLSRIHADPAATVAVVTGRSFADARRRVPIEGCRIAGNHGFELAVDGSKTVHPAAEAAEPTIGAICGTLEEDLADVDGALVEDKGVTATIHYRLADAETAETIRERVHEAVDRHDEDDAVRITSGKQILEVRPAVEWDKGRAVEWLRDECIPAGEEWLTMYVGDDVTDEAAFRALDGDDAGVKVGPGETAADYRVEGPEAVARLLDLIAESGLERADSR